MSFVVGQDEYSFKIVIPKRGSIARGICCFASRSRFLADKPARNDKSVRMHYLGCRDVACNVSRTSEWGRLLHSPEIVFLIGVMINGRMQRRIVFRGMRHRHGRMNVALSRNHRSRPHVPL